MPTATTMELPKTYDPGEFENICKDVISYLPSGKNLEYETFASRGEPQYGIDIRSKTELSNGKIICVQCKNYIQEKTPADFVKIIEADLKKAYAHFNIETFIVMTALNEKRGSYQTEIDRKDWGGYDKPIVYYWNEIEEIIADNKELFKKHYPSLFYMRESESFGRTENYFYNPDNERFIEGMISVRPKHVYFGRGANNEFFLIASMFICNGKKNDIRLKKFDYLGLASYQELLCEDRFDISKNNIIVEKGKSHVHIFFFPLMRVFTSKLSVPNSLYCYWDLYYEDV